MECFNDYPKLWEFNDNIDQVILKAKSKGAWTCKLVEESDPSFVEGYLADNGEIFCYVTKADRYVG